MSPQQQTRVPAPKRVSDRRWKDLVERFPKTCRLVLAPPSLRSSWALKIGPGGGDNTEDITVCMRYHTVFSRGVFLGGAVSPTPKNGNDCSVGKVFSVNPGG